MALDRLLSGVGGEVLTVCTWQWGDKYSDDYVTKLAAGVRRHLRQPHHFIVAKPEPGDENLVGRGCFCRLRMFDPEWQAARGIDERLVCLDLDLVITGELDTLFNRPESFMILGGANSVNPNPFNCSVMMLRAGFYKNTWSDFTLEAAEKVPWYAFPDDQSWIWHKIPRAVTWQCGPRSGIWSFRKRGWPEDDRLPEGARIVAFPGSRDPKQFEHLDWVKENWK
jgi:hypothetical protein